MGVLSPGGWQADPGSSLPRGVVDELCEELSVGGYEHGGRLFLASPRSIASLHSGGHRQGWGMPSPLPHLGPLLAPDCWLSDCAQWS